MKPQYIEIDEDGNKAYYSDRNMTILHRLDGPAFEWADGDKGWHVNGKLHRLDGPAYEYADGYKTWYVHGEPLSEDEFNKLTAKETVLTMDDIAAKFGVNVATLKIAK